MASITVKGSFDRTKSFFNRMKNREYLRVLDRYGKLGVDALAQNTPKDSGKTAHSWNYEVDVSGDAATITWTNSNVNRGINIAVILDVGHGTGTGGYVRGRNYISPAIQPIFDHIAEAAWREVTSS